MRNVLFAAVLAACTAIAAPAQEPIEQELNLKLTMTLTKPVCVLNDDLQVEVTLTNNGEAAEIPDLVLEERSLTFQVRVEKPGGRLTIFHTITRGDPHIAARLPLPKVSLDKDKSLSRLFRIPAIRTGKMDVKAVYKGTTRTVESQMMNATVRPTGQGSRLVAVLRVEEYDDIVIDLDTENAPLSVLHFARLAKCGFYDGMIFHRVIRSNWVQTGCPYDLGIGGPGYAVKAEKTTQKAKEFDLGCVAFSTYEKVGYVGSQFFIGTGRVKALDGKYPVFGRVTEQGSLDALKKLDTVPTDRDKDDRPKEKVILKNVSIEVRK
ncbi:MAG: peptidylprolyl isomerase [Planctomycetota bacterium]